LEEIGGPTAAAGKEEVVAVTRMSREEGEERKKEERKREEEEATCRFKLRSVAPTRLTRLVDTRRETVGPSITPDHSTTPSYVAQCPPVWCTGHVSALP
jgi:hypothetical protein